METPYHDGRAANMPESLWAATTRPLGPTPRPSEGGRFDVIVVGGGFMGVATALALAERNVRVALIEASRIGWGASGRNHGLLVPGLKRDPDDVRALLGREGGEKLLRFAGAAPDRVRDLIDRFQIGCDLNSRGWIQAAHAQAALPLIENRVRAWQALGAAVETIPQSTLRDRLGTTYYAGAWFDPRGGSLNPLAYLRGLAAAASVLGATLYEESPALACERSDRGWTTVTPRARIHSDTVVVCTNAYCHTLAELRGAVFPLRTAQVASAPLDADSARRILPGGESASDTQRLLTSFRLTADRRLIMGGAWATAGDEHPGMFSRLHRAAQDRFPDLGLLRWEFGWSGYLALTPDHLPQLVRLRDGRLFGTACNGRGIAMATVTGYEIARLVCGGADSDCPLPLRRLKRSPVFAFRRPGVAVAVVAKRLLDFGERQISPKAPS